VKTFPAVSLFANCGAGDVGYRRAGFRFEVMAELVPHRLEVCLLNHPGAVGVVGDLRETWRDVVACYRKKAGRTSPALLCACPPCQGMSSARSGKGKHTDAAAGSRDQRNLLVTVIANVAKALKPEVVVVENVPAFLTRLVEHPENRRPTSATRYLVDALGQDYDHFAMITDLADYGIPQNRVRTFLTFVRRDNPGLTRMRSMGRAPFPRPTHGGGTDAPQITFAAAMKALNLPPLDASSEERSLAPGFKGLHTVPVWSPRVYAMVQAMPEGESAWNNQKCGACGSVNVGTGDAECPRCGGPLLRPVVRLANGSHRLVRGFKTSYRRMRSDRPSATITTASGHIGSDNAIHPTENRLLSVLECAALQTFPSSFHWGSVPKEFGLTNVRAMVGEAVPPAFTYLHGAVIRSLFTRRSTVTPIAFSDSRVQKALGKIDSLAGGATSAAA